MAVKTADVTLVARLDGVVPAMSTVVSVSVALW